LIPAPDGRNSMSTPTAGRYLCWIRQLAIRCVGEEARGGWRWTPVGGPVIGQGASRWYSCFLPTTRAAAICLIWCGGVRLREREWKRGVVPAGLVFLKGKVVVSVSFRVRLWSGGGGRAGRSRWSRGGEEFVRLASGGFGPPNGCYRPLSSL
jgi:hypothetical protein